MQTSGVGEALIRPGFHNSQLAPARTTKLPYRLPKPYPLGASWAASVAALPIQLSHLCTFAISSGLRHLLSPVVNSTMFFKALHIPLYLRQSLRLQRPSKWTLKFSQCRYLCPRTSCTRPGADSSLPLQHSTREQIDRQGAYAPRKTPQTGRL